MSDKARPAGKAGSPLPAPPLTDPPGSVNKNDDINQAICGGVVVVAVASRVRRSGHLLRGARLSAPPRADEHDYEAARRLHLSEW